VIKKLDKKTKKDFLHYFDFDAFCDHPEWSYCYCTFFHFTKEEIDNNINGSTKKGVRKCASELIDDGLLQGYLAYDDTKVVGWVNTNLRSAYPRIPQHYKIKKKDDTIVSVVCFLTHPDYRHRGVAAALLQHVVENAKESGARLVQGYPNRMAQDQYDQYPGPLNMYLRHDFKVTREEKNFWVVERDLTAE